MQRAFFTSPYRVIFKIVKKLHSSILALLFALCGGAAAQKESPQAPVDSGAIIMPPATDPGAGAVTRPPADADPADAEKRTDGQGRAARARQNDNSGKASAKKKSKQDDCRGRADLCKQDSPR